MSCVSDTIFAVSNNSNYEHRKWSAFSTSPVLIVQSPSEAKPSLFLPKGFLLLYKDLFVSSRSGQWISWLVPKIKANPIHRILKAPYLTAHHWKLYPSLYQTGKRWKQVSRRLQMICLCGRIQKKIAEVHRKNKPSSASCWRMLWRRGVRTALWSRRKCPSKALSLPSSEQSRARVPLESQRDRTSPG